MMNKTIKKLLMLTLTFTAIAAFAGCSSSASSDKKEPVSESSSDSASGETASSDSIFAAMDTTTIDGEKMDSSLFAKNKVTLVNLWNVGCTPCVEEIPVLDKLNREYEGKGAAIVGLYFANSEYLAAEKAEIDEILEKAGAEYPQLALSEEMADSETIAAVQAFPTTYVVDSEGNIVNKIEGSNNYEGWKAFIEEELKKADADA